MALNRKALAALIAVFSMFGIALAQSGNGAPGGFGQPSDDMIFHFSPFGLLRIPEVAVELKIAPDQKKKLAAMQAEYKASVIKLGENVREKGAGWDELTNRVQKVNEQFTGRLIAVLTPAQRQRQFELTVQISGLMAIFLPEVQRRLGLTQRQKNAINNLALKHQQANASVFQKAQTQEISWEDAQRIFKKNQDVLSKELLKVLDRQQLAKYKAMPGKPFAFPKPKIPMGGFGGPLMR